MLGVYLHWPWCVQKCPFCDFNAHNIKHSPNNFDDNYLLAIRKNIAEYKQKFHIQTASSIFIGGGTPSLMPVATLESALKIINEQMHISSNAEITIEVNPGKIPTDYFKELAAIGINRVSLGAQTFNDRSLKLLGRSHNTSDNKYAITEAMKIFDNINIDIMYGLPYQSVNHAINDLKIACEYEPEHISWYQLTIEPKTFFTKYTPDLPNDNQIANIENLGKTHLANNKWQQYEVSAFSKNKQCQHNLKYWQFDDYLGLGPGAHGKISDHKNQKIWRTHTKAHPKLYLSQPKLYLQSIKHEEIILEYLLNTLRLKNFIIDKNNFTKKTFLHFSELRNTLKIHQLDSFFKIQQNSIQLLDRGFELSQSILARLDNAPK